MNTTASPTWDLNTLPIVYASDLPACVGACDQGRRPCRHPLACSVRCADEEERADVAAELTTDLEPLTRDEAMSALEAVLDGALDAKPGGYPVLWWVCMVVLSITALAIAVMPAPL